MIKLIVNQELYVKKIMSKLVFVFNFICIFLLSLCLFFIFFFLHHFKWFSANSLTIKKEEVRATAHCFQAFQDNNSNTSFVSLCFFGIIFSKIYIFWNLRETNQSSICSVWSHQTVISCLWLFFVGSHHKFRNFKKTANIFVQLHYQCCTPGYIVMI